MIREDRTHGLSIASARGNTARCELHIVAASRRKYMRMIYGLVHDIEIPLDAVAFTLEHGVVPGVPALPDSSATVSRSHLKSGF